MISAADAEKYEGIDWEKLHWIAPSLAEKYERLMGYEYWNYDALLEARRFFAQYKVKPFLDDSDSENWLDFGHEIEIEGWKDDGPPLMSRSREEIDKILLSPAITGELKANFSNSFMHQAMDLPPLIKAEFQATKKVKREPVKFISNEFFTFWVTEGNNGLVVSKSGANGSGKTAKGLWIGAMALERIDTLKMATNVVVRPETETMKKRIQRFRTIGEWLLRILDNRIVGLRTFSDIDELTNSNIRKKTTMHGVTLSIDRVDKGTRKIGDDNMFQWHFASEVPTEIMTKSLLKITAYGSTAVPQQRHMADIDFDYGEGRERKYVNGIPDSPIKFNTGRFSWFILDVDVDALFFRFAKMQDDLDDDREAYQKMRDLVQLAIEKNEDKELEPDMFLHIKEAARRIQETQNAILRSQIFEKQDRKSDGIWVRPIEGYGWDAQPLPEGEEQKPPEGNEPEKMEEVIGDD